MTFDRHSLKTEQLVGADTEIGRWWRSFNTLTRIGPYLFVHAGVSPAIAPVKIDLDKFNAALRAYTRNNRYEISNNARLLAAFHKTMGDGVLKRFHKRFPSLY